MLYWEHWGHTGILLEELWLVSIVLGVLVACWKHWAHTGTVAARTGIVPDLWCRPVLYWEHWAHTGMVLGVPTLLVSATFHYFTLVVSPF